MKKFLLKLVGWREQRNPSHFVEREAIEHANAEERRQQAMIHEKERLRDNMEKREEPAEGVILGPSDSATREEA